MRFEKIVIATHGQFGEYLLKSAEMIVGVQKDIEACSYLEGMSLEAFSKDIESRIKGYKTLLLVDLFGGTPCNVSLGLSQNNELAVVTGINLATLIEAIMNYKAYSVSELFKHLHTINRMGFRVIEKGKEISCG